MMVYSENETLRDGSPVVVRAITPDDKSALQDALGRLSPESAYYRFFYPKRKLSARELEYLTNVDFSHHVALGVGLLHDDDKVTPVGIGRYIVKEPENNSAEIAFVVADDYQGLGAGTMLLKHLVRIARENGIDRFTATVLEGNQRMLSVFNHSRLPLHRSTTAGVVEIVLTLNNP